MPVTAYQPVSYSTDEIASLRREIAVLRSQLNKANELIKQCLDIQKELMEQHKPAQPQLHFETVTDVHGCDVSGLFFKNY